MELAPALLSAVAAAGSADISDAAFKSMLQQADALIQQSITSTQQGSAPPPQSAVPGQLTAASVRSRR